MKTKIITIDGPAGAGKTTVSKLLSQKLNCIYVDTGALYRGVAYEIKQQNADWENDASLDTFLNQLDLSFKMDQGDLILMSSGKNITDHIRTPEVTMLASSTSAKPSVRAALLDIQRDIANSQDAVFEGRDMGTVVFPNATFKFFLMADLSIRAKRRFDETSGDSKNLVDIKDQMETRDNNDSSRESAPLKKADDAIEIDSTNLSADQVVECMLNIIEKP